MNAPANVDGRSQAVARVVSLYAPALNAIRPGCGDEEQRLRCGILYLRDRAAAALSKATWEASLLFAAIDSIATVHVFANIPAAELEELHHSLVRLNSVATALHQRGPATDMAS